MADVASSLKNWSGTPASNNPTSATTIGTGLAPNFQQIQATLRNELATRSASVTAAATTDIGVKDEGTVLVTNAAGTIAITSFGTVSAGIQKLVTFTVSGGSLSLTHNATSMILPSSANITVTTGASLLAESLGSGNWKIHWYVNQDGTALLGVTPAQLQKQTYTAFTTGGTSSAFTLTPSPAITANATGTRFNITLNAAPTGSPTLAVSGQTAKSLKYYDATGTKQFITSAVAPINWNSDVIDDGTDWVMQDILPVAINFASNAEYVTGTDTTKALNSATARARNIVSGTAVSATGTSVDFTGLPTWVKKITVMFNGVSTNGTSPMLLQIGSGSIENTGYSGTTSNIGSTANYANFTTGYQLQQQNSAGNVLSGSLELTLLGSNSWQISGVLAYTNTPFFSITGGAKTLAGVLDRLRFTTVNGTDSYDAGTFNIHYA